jgi:hypothetical protein
MSEGKRVTLADAFKRREAEIKAEIDAQAAWEATPEGAAWRAAQDAHHRRMVEAEARFAAEHPPEDEDEEEEDEDDDGEDDA